MKKIVLSLMVLGVFGSCELGNNMVNPGGSETPFVIITSSPTNNATVSTNFVVNGSTYNANGISSARLYFCNTNKAVTNYVSATMDGEPLTILSAPLSINNPDFYYIWFWASDAHNNVARGPIHMVKVTAPDPVDPDLTAPVLTISSPSNNQIVGSDITVSGTALDTNSGVQTVYISLNSNAFVTAPLNSGNWSRSFTLTAPGLNSIKAYAVDNAGNISATNQIMVNYDASTPSVSISFPANGILTNVSSLNISGTASVQGSTISQVQLKVNGAAYTSVTGTTAWSKSGVSLVQGTNTLIAKATAVNTKTAESSPVKVIVDTIAPLAAINSPVDGSIIQGSSAMVTISGTAFDSGSGLEGIYLSTGGSYVKISSSPNWSYAINLPAAAYTLSVYSKDKAGNKSSIDSISITIQDTPTVGLTVHYKNTSSWSTVLIHYWDVLPSGTISNSVWHGKNMVYEGNNWWMFTITNATSFKMVFNDGGSLQTGNLARASKEGWYDGGVWYDYNTDDPIPPVIKATPGNNTTNTNTISVTLTGSQDGDIIYWTTNGVTPTTASAMFSGPIQISRTGNTTLKAFGVNSLAVAGNQYSFSYYVNPALDLAPPSITNFKAVGHYDNPVNVSFNIKDNRNGTTTAYYNTNGTPATTSDMVYVSGDASGSGLAGNNIYLTSTRRFSFLIVDSSGNKTTASYYYHVGSFQAPRIDPRQETIYFLLTSRWFDGDSANSVGDEWCSYTTNRAANPNNGFTGPEDTSWRGDFKGLVQKMDYIKALGFTTIWITPIVQNRGPLCYHGYHAWDFTKEDARLESPGYDFQRVIDEAHARGMKICLDIVINHSGRYGIKDHAEIKYNTSPTLNPAPATPTPNWEYDGLTSPGLDSNGNPIPPYKRVSGVYAVRGFEPDDIAAWSYLGNAELYNYPSRESYVKTVDGMEDPNNNSLDYAGYQNSSRWIRGHNTGFPTGSGSFDNYPDAHFDSLHEDCPDLNTENPEVQQYLLNAYYRYIDMGVDMFRVDTVMHMHKKTLNDVYWPGLMNRAHTAQAKSARGGGDFFIFGEVANFVMTLNDKAFNLRQQNYTWDNNNSEDTGSANHWMNGNAYRTPDYSKKAPNGSTPYHVAAIDMVGYNQLVNGEWAPYGHGVGTDGRYNDATFMPWYADSHDYGPNKSPYRYTGNFMQVWSLMFTWRGIPIVYYGSEIRFGQGLHMDWPGSTDASLEKTARGYYGGYLDGSVSATGFGSYTASGTVNTTLSHAYAQHLMRLNKIRQAVPALQMGQYSTEGCGGDGLSFKRRYTGTLGEDNDGPHVDSYCIVGVGNGTHSYSGILNGTYVDVVTGDTKVVNGGSMSFSVPGGAENLRVYVLQGLTSDIPAPSAAVITPSANLF